MLKTNLNDAKLRERLYFAPLQFPDPTPLNATTSATTGNDLSPQNNKVYYDKNLIRLAGPNLIHDQFAKKVTIPKNHGTKMEFRGFEPLAKSLTPLTEGVTPEGGKLDMFTVTATLKQYGYYIALTDLLEMTAIDNNVLEAQEMLGDQAGRTLDTITREVINAGTNVQYAEGQVSSRSALTQNMKLTVKAIKMAVRTLKKQNTPRINGKYMGIIGPDLAYDLSEDDEYKDLFKYTDNSSFKNGYLFDLAGVEFYESSEAKIWASAGATGSDSKAGDVGSALIIGKDAYAVTDLAGEGMEAIIKQLGSAGTADALNQRSTVGWKALKAAVILTNQYMVRIEVGMSTSDHKAN